MLPAQCYWLSITDSVLLAQCYWLSVTGSVGSVVLAQCYWLSVTGSVLLAQCYLENFHVGRDRQQVAQYNTFLFLESSNMLPSV